MYSKKNYEDRLLLTKSYKIKQPKLILRHVILKSQNIPSLSYSISYYFINCKISVRDKLRQFKLLQGPPSLKKKKCYFIRINNEPDLTFKKNIIWFIYHVLKRPYEKKSCNYSVFFKKLFSYSPFFFFLQICISLIKII